MAYTFFPYTVHGYIMIVCVLPDHTVCTDDKLWFGVPLVVCDVIVCL